ncbi:MAG TPA: MoaD/ThiS family protein, partial [Chloroflexota bacterium]|nr:MoaD/ThiS family protein [Chloroflexota bacterium]
MRDLTGGQTVIAVKGSTVAEVIDNLEARYPGAKKRLLSGAKLKPNIGVAVDGDVSRIGLREPVRPTSEIHFLPAISGGEGQLGVRGPRS